MSRKQPIRYPNSIARANAIIYPFTLYITKQKSIKELRHAWDILCKKEPRLPSSQGLEASGITSHASCYFLLDHTALICYWDSRPSLSTIAHESVHAAMYFLCGVGIEPTQQHDEVLAYTVGWCADETDKYLKQVRK